MVHMDRAEGTTYRDELMFQIIQICSQNDYQVSSSPVCFNILLLV
jgi:hypothetical protein